jgi:hypothetical protein
MSALTKAITREIIEDFTKDISQRKRLGSNTAIQSGMLNMVFMPISCS